MAGSCLRVDPPFVEFKDVKVGEIYKKTVKVTNVGKTLKKIVIVEPALKLFKLTPCGQAVFLASGLSVAGLLEFTPEDEEEVRDCITVNVDDVETMQIPVQGIPRTCSLLMDSLLDFGCIVASNQLVSKHHPITNQGSAPGFFQVQCGSGKPWLSISPSSGVIAGDATWWLKVEVRTDRPRHISEEVLVMLQNRSAVALCIKAEVVERCLEVLDLQGTPLSCLWFGPVYFGTSSVQKVVLRNNAPQACDWVCMLQDKAAGTEVETDLQKSTDALLVERMEEMEGGRSDIADLPQILVWGPTEGRLGPYKKTTLAVRFSPISKRRTRGCRQDYCLFLSFDCVERKHGFAPRDANSSVELAVMGSGLPVALVPSPSDRLDFLSCLAGQHVDLLCVLQNCCSQLPVSFRFRKLAHFSAEPSAATVEPGQCQDVVLTFNARQFGRFQVRQKIDVVGRVASSSEDITELEVCSFHNISLSLSAICHAGPVRSPARSLTFPNNTSIFRPASPHRVYRPALIKKQQHDQIYADFINLLRETRLQTSKDREQKKVDNNVDIGIIPCHGLVPPTLSINDLDWSHNSQMKSGSKCPQITTSTESSSQVSEVICAFPSTSQEVADCKRTLTAQELYHVVIDPSFVDFGCVCVQSVCVRMLTLVNQLSKHVWVQLEADCSELQASSPLSHVLPPFSRATLPLTFQSNKLGCFHRSLSYSVNMHHPGQIVAEAQVVPLTVELSTNLLVLRPPPAMLAAGHRSSVTLRNQCSRAAEFTWRQAVTDGAVFSVRPATGEVEPYRELDCEVVWHPSFSSPSEEDLDLCVHEGSTHRLHCVAKVGTTTVQPAERRILFESVPLNTPSVRTAVLHNTGKNHAYFKVLDVCPLPGMVVSPSEGAVPSKGQAMFKIHLNPDFVSKFETKVEIALRNMKSVELSVGGSVEPPNVEISVSRFQFFGVHVGCQRVIPFVLTNHSTAAARVTFDLSKHEDFSIQLPQGEATKEEAGLSVVEVSGCQIEECSLVFSPTKVLSYDFCLPLMVNGVKWPRARSSASPPRLSLSSPSMPSAARLKHVKPLTASVCVAAQQPLWIRATVLCAPLEMSPSVLQFYVEPQSNTYSQTVELKAEQEDSASWCGVAGQRLHWWFDCSAAAGLSDARTERTPCALSPSSGSLGPGQSLFVVVTVSSEAVRTGTQETKLSIPLYLGGEGGEWTQGRQVQQPYRELTVSVTLELPSITIQPSQILLSPVPLGRSTGTIVTLIAAGYPGGTRISAEVDLVTVEDGTQVQPLSVTFPEGNSIPPQDHHQEARVTSLLCSVSFCSELPLSLCTSITFTDHMHNRFQVSLCAVAENCLLTVWPYAALHHVDQHIVIKSGSSAVEAILQPCSSPSPGPAESSLSFDYSCSTSESSDFSDSQRTSEESSRDRDTPAGPCVPGSPAASTVEGHFYQNVVLAVERWFSLFGWPSGPHAVSIPFTLRRVTSNVQKSHSNSRTYRISQNIDTRSVLDMLHHLTGRQIPGISLSGTFSSDVKQRTNQLLQQHEATLAFLRVQGAFLSHIRPEYLLDVLEFKHWCSLQTNNRNDGLDYRCIDYESLSKRSWTDVLLQIYKVLVLSRVSERAPKTAPNHRNTEGVFLDSSQPLASNIYSSQELQLLSWLNVHYESMRTVMWGADGAPPARWIVNFKFDLVDGLVLASLLAVYCPYLIRSHFRRMYTTVSSLEQIFHNSIIVVQALTALRLNINIEPTDLSDPNPVQMLILCVHLYEMLPQYLPVHTVTLSGGLHSTFSNQVRLKNPSTQPVKHQAFFVGDDALLFSFPHGSSVTIPPRSSAELTVQFSCFHLHPVEILLLISSSASDLRCTTLAFKVQTHVSHITPTKTVSCNSPCYQMNFIQVPLINTLNKEADFRVVLVESTFNPLESTFNPLESTFKPLEPEMRTDSFLQEASSTASMKMTSHVTDGREMNDGGGSEFLSPVKRVFLKAGQAAALSILYLPFVPATKYCSVLLTCPQVGDLVFMVKATSELPLPSPLTLRPSCYSRSTQGSSETAVCVPVLTLQSMVGEVCEVLLGVPRVNMLWEQALATWGQQRMASDEHKRRTLTRTLRSSTVRSAVATQKLLTQQLHHSKGTEYSVAVSLPQYFTLPRTVAIPITEDTNISWENPADCGFVDIPLRFQSHSEGRFLCEVVLRSGWDIRVHQVEVQVFSQGKRPLGNDCDGTENMFAIRGERTSPLPRDHVVLHCPVGRTTHTQLDVPNDSQKLLTLKMVTDLSILSGNPSLEIKPGRSCPYRLAISPWKRGKCTGTVSFVEHGDMQKSEKAFEHYEISFSLEIICEPAAPVKVIDVQCEAQRSVAIEIPVYNPGEKRLALEVYLEGENLSGASRISVPPRKTLTYRAAFSPVVVRRTAGSVVFQSEKVGEFWYQLELYSLPPLVSTLPRACCQLGQWIRLNIPLINPTAETLELLVTNSNPRNYTLEMKSASSLTLDPQSFAHLVVRFSPSSVGDEDHQGRIEFKCSQLRDWCVLLSGCGLHPDGKEPLCISSLIGSSSSITIPLSNPTELPTALTIKITDEDPHGALACHPATDQKAFTVPLSHTEGFQIKARATVDVPVVFTPSCGELQQAWLCVTMKPVLDTNMKFSIQHSFRPEEELTNICWTYSLCGIPVEVPAQTFPLAVLQCEAGGQLEKEVDVHLTGDTLVSRGQKHGGVTLVRMEDFLCEVHSDHDTEYSEEEEEEDRLSISATAASRDPESGIVLLTLRLVYNPLRTCRCSSVIVVQSASGHVWRFPIILVATKPAVDDVIVMETELDQTSAVCFRVTSKTRKSKPFTAEFLPGSSSEFRVTPSSGTLPPADTPGVLITKRRARLAIKAADVWWTYEVRGKSPENSPRRCSSPTTARL